MTNFVKKNQDVILIAFVIVVVYFAFFNDNGKLFGKSVNGNGNGNGNGDILPEGEGATAEGSDYALGNYPVEDRRYLDWWGATMGLW